MTVVSEHKPLSERKARIAVTEEAGFRRLSVVSVLAGLVTAYGTFAIVASVVGAVLSSMEVETDFRTNDWTGSGAVALLATAVSLLVAYLFGGYVAGRMARRASMLHGVAVFVASIVVAAIVGTLIAVLTDDEQIRENLQSIGVPVSSDQVSGVAIVGAIVALVAMLVGSLLGAMLGERWHTKLARRVSDPDIGATAARRERAEMAERDAREDVDRDEVMRRERAGVTDQDRDEALRPERDEMTDEDRDEALRRERAEMADLAARDNVDRDDRDSRDEVVGRDPAGRSGQFDVPHAVDYAEPLRDRDRIR